ncbi:SET and MYND domain-containing protein DDB_G0273589-like [Sitodiplosis mosellana]|uniref:SET and MYND domain-containing protein DDB_G0273589-like n=1 Tax=Sitodiplosis mosellana TaxID=263140 RepID=UPI002444166B|nr:SET and MYND domain-containing protein DDB_G0273589-like [Sitodiplosis mosellana]
MSSPSTSVNVLWKKDESPNSDSYVNIFNVKGHEVSLQMVKLQYAMSKASFNYTRDEAFAKCLRECGKDFFKDGDFFKAMFTFNCGLTKITNGSEELGIAYANRSMCFLRLDMPEKALVDIELARKSNYPANLMHKLTVREDKCKHLLEDEEFKAKRFKLRAPMLSFKEHESFAGVADCLEIRKNDDFGYHVVTTRDLEIGQTVLVEPSFAITPKRFENIGRDRCWNCYKDMQNFIACSNQNYIGSLYCDANCEEQSFHRYECGLPNLSRKETTDLVQKILHKLTVTFPDIDLLMKTVEALVNDEEVTDLSSMEQKRFCSIFKLIHKHELKHNQQAKLLIPSANTFVMVMDIPDFKEIFKTEEQLRFLQHLILHLHHVTEHAFDLHEYSPNGSNEPIMAHTFLHYASAVYPFACYMKHSCVPNVFWYSIDDRLIGKVIRPIKTGEQVFRSYLPATNTYQSEKDFEIGPIEERYNFECQCSHCSDEPSENVNYVRDQQWFEAMAPMEMKLKDFRKLSREEIDEYEKKAVELVKKYNDISPCSIQDNLILIWILLSQYF